MKSLRRRTTTPTINDRNKIAPITTKIINLQAGAGTELATLDSGLTYISIPDGETIPAEQPVEIESTISAVTLTPELKAEITANSPHIKLINKRIIEKIREVYSVDDEAYYSRIGVGSALGIYVFEAGEEKELIDYSVFVQLKRTEARAAKALLGL